MRQWIRKSNVRLLVMSVGLCAGVLSGCEPTIQETILTGANEAANTMGTSLIDALFQSLAPEEATDLVLL